MLADYLPIAMLLGLSALFGLASLWVSSKLGHPQRPTPAKLQPYDCGITSVHTQSEPFPVKFYLIAMLFIIFDVEVVFLYPWAVVFREMGLFGLGEMGFFVGLLFAAYVYLWRKGAFDWDDTGEMRRRYVDREMRILERAS